MNYPISHPDFEDGRIALRIESIWKSAKFYDGPREIQFKKGKAIIMDKSGHQRELSLKSNFLDPIPKIDLDGQVISVARPLTKMEYAWMALPALLIFGGGAIGGACGYVAATQNAKIFRSDRTNAAKYAHSLFVSLSWTAFFICVVIVIQLIMGIE